MSCTGSRPVVKAQGDPSISAGPGRGKNPPIRHWMKQGDAIELVIGGIQYDTICSHASCPGGRKGCWAKFLVLPSLPRTCIRSSMFCCVLILWTLVWLCLISYWQGFSLLPVSKVSLLHHRGELWVLGLPIIPSTCYGEENVFLPFTASRGHPWVFLTSPLPLLSSSPCSPSSRP